MCLSKNSTLLSIIDVDRSKRKSKCNVNVKGVDSLSIDPTAYFDRDIYVQINNKQ